MKVVAILFSLLTSILLIASSACTPQPTTLQKSSAAKEDGSFTNMNKAQRRAAIKEAQDYFNNCIGGPSR